MANLSINLLPEQVSAEKKQRAKAATFVQISVLILVLIFVASGVILSFRFSQAAQLSKLQSQINSVKDEINSPDSTKREGLLVTLKQRLDSLNEANSKSYPAQYAFSLINSMLPPNTQITGLNLDKTGKVTLEITSPDTTTLQSFLNNLMDPQINQQKVSSAAVQSINMNKDNTYATSLNFKLAGGVK
jgi:Tfp pilus assembly protein PilN